MERALDSLGRKWALLIVRDVAFLRRHRFGEILRQHEGLTARTLSRRLKELTEDGVIRRREGDDGVKYEATEKGMDALFVLFAFLRYGIRHLRTADEPEPTLDG